MWQTLPPLQDVQADPHTLQRLADVARCGDHRTLQTYMQAFAQACGNARQCCKESAALLRPYVFDPAWRATQEMGVQVHYDLKVKVLAEWDKVACRLETQRLALLEEADVERERQRWWEETQQFLFGPDTGGSDLLEAPDFEACVGTTADVTGGVPDEDCHAIAGDAEDVSSMGDDGVMMWDPVTRSRLKDLTTLYEDHLLLVIPALHADWEERIRQVPFMSWWCDSSHALYPSFLHDAGDLEVDPSDVDILFEYQKLHYNRYCENLRTLSRQLVLELVCIEERKAKNQMVRAELTLRIRELTRTAVEVLECQGTWRRRVAQRFEEVERMQIAAKRRLLACYALQLRTPSTPPVAAPPSVETGSEEVKLGVPGAAHAKDDPVAVGMCDTPPPSTLALPYPDLPAAPTGASHDSPAPDSSPQTAGPLNFLDMVTTGGGLSAGIAALDLLQRVACEDRLEPKDVLAVAEQQFEVDYVFLPPRCTFPIRAPAVLFCPTTASAVAAPGSLLCLRALPSSPWEWETVARQRPAAVVYCTAVPGEPVHLNPQPGLVCPVGRVATITPIASICSAGFPMGTLFRPGAQYRCRAQAALQSAWDLGDLTLLRAAARADVDVAPLLRRLCLQDNAAAVAAILAGVVDAGRPLPTMDGLEMATSASEGVVQLLLGHRLLDGAAWYTVAPRRLTWTALHAAAQNNTVGVVAALAHSPGTDMQALAWHEGAQKSALFFACDRPTLEPGLVEYLLRCGVAVDVAAVDEAARRGAWAEALLLLRHASEVVKARSVALWYACAAAPVSTVQQMVALGCPADSKLPAPDRTPLHAACLRAPADAVPLVQLLLEAGAFVDVGYRCAWFRGAMRQTSNCTPLFCACQAGHPMLVKLLLQRGARIDTTAEAQFVWEKYSADDTARWCPAVWRCERHHVQPKGCTALEVARRGGHCDIVDLLLGHWPLQRHLAFSTAR